MYSAFRLGRGRQRKKLTVVEFACNVNTLGGKESQDLGGILSCKYLASLGYMRPCLQRKDILSVT